MSGVVGRLTLSAGVLAAVIAFVAWRDVVALGEIVKEAIMSKEKPEGPSGVIVFEWKCRDLSHGHSAPLRLEVKQDESDLTEWIRFAELALARQQATHPPEVIPR